MEVWRRDGPGAQGKGGTAQQAGQCNGLWPVGTTLAQGAGAARRQPRLSWPASAAPAPPPPTPPPRAGCQGQPVDQAAPQLPGSRSHAAHARLGRRRRHQPQAALRAVQDVHEQLRGRGGRGRGRAAFWGGWRRRPYDRGGRCGSWLAGVRWLGCGLCPHYTGLARHLQTAPSHCQPAPPALQASAASTA